MTWPLAKKYLLHLQDPPVKTPLKIYTRFQKQKAESQHITRPN